MQDCVCSGELRVKKLYIVRSSPPPPSSMMAKVVAIPPTLAASQTFKPLVCHWFNAPLGLSSALGGLGDSIGQSLITSFYYMTHDAFHQQWRK